MKKIISLLIILSVILSLVSCNFISDIAVGKSPTINGVSIKEYTIVYDAEGLDYNLRAAEYIKAQAEERFGVELAMVDDSEAQADYEIVIGETSRPISAELDAECEGLQFAMMAKNGSVALEGDYFIIAAAAYFFVDSYMPKDGGDFLLEDSVIVRDPIVKEAKELDDFGEFELMEAIGRRRGCLISGGEVNTERTAILLLDEFRSAKIGRITLEIPDQRFPKKESATNE